MLTESRQGLRISTRLDYWAAISQRKPKRLLKDQESGKSRSLERASYASTPISRDAPVTATTTINHKQTPKRVRPFPAAGRVRGRLTMIRSKILG